ncbi:hypothetical protein L1049_014734 [Liquidambar formosana]|uniref:Uncharacterized protein n=1 Tax=Liquidambar formosana TaxID=63359 RepID=A0AAP0RWX4_LIQFO
MWGDGGRLYWARKEAPKVEGIVVVFAWVSIQEKHLKSYVDLYASLGWSTLVCYADFLNAFDPEKATSLAFVVLNELVEIVEGTCEGQLNLDDNQLVKTCLSGHIYDSCPLDFTSDLGARFALHPTILKMPWTIKTCVMGLNPNVLSIGRLYTLQLVWRHQFLILCSENDDHAPYHVICNFAQRLQDLGGDVKLVKWNGSPHIGHYKHYPIQYKAAVTNLLERATSVYSQKIRQLEGERSGELICDLQTAAVNSSQSLRRVAVEPSDHFFLPSSAGYHNGSGSGSSQDEQKERSIHLQNPPSLNAHSVLGQILFDVCIPKNIEGWDIKFSGSLNGQPLASARRHSPFEGIKCIRRSRL